MSTNQSPSRAVLIVLDSVGIGALPDAAQYGDAGSNTLSHVLAAAPVALPNLTAMGLGLIEGVQGLPHVEAPTASYGRMAEFSAGKDTTTGHWELAGLT
ncbi:MAG: phosphopentomutase, partial [Clostridia bacterium]|nr:phosphopentomutase [Clostridia bacterium]